MSSSAPFTVPGSLAPDAYGEWPHGPLRALTHVLGETLRALAGTPQTRLTAALGPTETTALVESTLELPDAGAVWIAGRRFTYTGTTDGSLTGLVAQVYRTVTLPTYSEVLLDPRSVEPT